MGLRGAMSNGELRGLEGRWVRLTVGAFAWTIEEVTREVADAWWEEHRPSTVQVPQMDLTRDQVTPISQVLPTGKPEKEALKEAIRAFGGKASHYAVLATLPQVPTPEAFAIPVYFYDQFMETNGFKARVQALLADQTFQDSPATRDEQLRLLRDDMKVAPLDAAFLADLEARLATDFAGLPMRFRSSTNAEDLEGFTGAGLYTSKTADPGDPNRTVADAIRKVWASVWSFRAFEERSFRNIDHLAVGMALLVHRSYPEEEASGVALTANPFDATGIEPAWYINVQAGDVSVVNPDPGITTDVILLFYGSPGQPISYLAHSNLVPPGQTVLTDPQVRTLGDALAAIHQHFLPIYGPAVGQASYYAMDVEFKFEDFGTGEAPQLQVKQARPHSGWGAQP
jgi:hypothetical protein